MQKVAVIGSGVIGLHAAIALLQQGHQVCIFTAQPSHETTSVVAGAIWMPFKVGPKKQALRWAQKSLAVYQQLAQITESGVSLCNHTEFCREPSTKPVWMKYAPIGHAPQCQIPKRFCEYYSVVIPVIDTVRYLSYLTQQFQQLGGEIFDAHIQDLSALPEFNIIINCSGVGASTLTQDKHVYPIKGQTFALKHPKQKIKDSVFYTDGEDTLLIVPHAEHFIIGVTVKEHDASEEYDHLAEHDLLMRACEFYPDIADCEIIARRVGFRPGRATGIRLEKEQRGKQTIIHHYGHGGAGITLAPGCTESLMQLLQH